MEKIIEFATLPSTNLYLKENYHQLPNKTVIVTNHQTAGRGRLSRVWEDSDDLLFSLLLKEQIPHNIANLSLLVAASLYKTLIKIVDNVTIKWPNDILVHGKKLSGILLESVVVGEQVDCIIIGVGINTNTTKIGSSIASKATSIYLETNYKTDKKTLLKSFLEEFTKDYQLYCTGKSDYLQICKLHSSVIGKLVNVMINNQQKKALVQDILDNGNILLLVDDQQIQLHSGEITLTELY
jgi:BirA family biotin operon repressor/biotin-[acetyl-CoA-carboxylase] ligase